MLKLEFNPRTKFTCAVSRATFLALSMFVFCSSSFVYAQMEEATNAPVVVQPGAPGEATKKLPSDAKAKMPPFSKKDVEFMQGMIHHHAQAVEMVALMDGRTENKELRLLGARISRSQADEMKLMKRWLEIRGEKISMPEMEMTGHHHHGDQRMMMPGMLTAEQMNALKNARGAEFDRLFLAGMIQHHEGALVMVRELFDTAGAGQDAELFSFATDVDGSQRAEIRIMQTMLGENP